MLIPGQLSILFAVQCPERSVWVPQKTGCILRMDGSYVEGGGCWFCISRAMMAVGHRIGWGGNMLERGGECEAISWVTKSWHATAMTCACATTKSCACATTKSHACKTTKSWNATHAHATSSQYWLTLTTSDAKVWFSPVLATILLNLEPDQNLEKAVARTVNQNWQNQFKQVWMGLNLQHGSKYINIFP